MVGIPPLPPLKYPVSFDRNHDIQSCAVSVVYCIYDKSRKRVVSQGTSRPCGENGNKISIHAEEKCIGFCRLQKKRKSLSRSKAGTLV